MTTLTRFADWPEKLAEFIEARRNMPFTFGTNDCCTFAAAAVKALTGVDYRHQLIETFGAYGTLAEAARRKEQTGGLEALATSILRDPIPVAFAGRGDIVLADAPDAVGDVDLRHLGVCLGTHVAAPGLKGLVFVPMSLAVKAWGV